MIIVIQLLTSLTSYIWRTNVDSYLSDLGSHGTVVVSRVQTLIGVC